MVLAVRRLASWDETGCVEVRGQLSGYDTLQQLGYKRQVWDRSVVVRYRRIQLRFLKNWSHQRVLLRWWKQARLERSIYQFSKNGVDWAALDDHGQSFIQAYLKGNSGWGVKLYSIQYPPQKTSEIPPIILMLIFHYQRQLDLEFNVCILFIFSQQNAFNATLLQ